MKKIIHIITGLNDGGAEAVLYRLCRYDEKAEHIVVSMMDVGKYGGLLKKEGIDVHCLNLSAGKVTFAALWKLYRLIRLLKPDVVQTWMYHADLIGGLVAKLAGVKKVFWNVRQTSLEPGKSKRSTILIAKLCAKLSGYIPEQIIYCAHEAQAIHENLGYKKGKAKVIGNGYDLGLFDQNAQFREMIRNEFSIATKEVLLGMVGRYDPQKDHSNLISALGIVNQKGFEFKLLLIGKQLDDSNDELLEQIKSESLSDNIRLLGQRTDIPSVMNALDIHVLSSSFGEGFPNVLAEAMACGAPCVTTDVGDAALIVGETGWVVPPKDQQALANAIMQAIQEKQENHQAWLNRQKECRARIVDNFSIEKMIEGYHRVWSEK
ncbi:glycosyltransferase family 4 protein [Thiomicrorhabdus aquaedulcis]|uniref:glycosyltransferase family 4 protein n=1 Tax=Thiomicrorhabdus aquaedulcis TaxID=2211106 RepID=UPI000FDC5A71|nr:glycosyltransferase [Thiomicrorhabdus aquaedulcis]